MRWSKRKETHHGYLVENAGFGEQGGGGHVVPWGYACAPASPVDSRSRDDRIRHPRRRARGHRDSGNHGLQAQTAGIVERHRGWHQRLIRRVAGAKGQATVEFAVVAAAFLVATAALMALWRVLGDGLFIEHALAVASHHLQLVAPVTITDVFLY